MILVVTGCRSGFGLLTAVEASRQGHTVYAGLRDLSTSGELLAASEGLDVRPVQLDVTKASDRAAVVAQVLDEQGRIDGLINNAGIAIAGPLETLDEDEFRAVMEVNLFAVWAMTNAVLPAMRAQGDGIIVTVSSLSGRVGNPGLGAYAASKFAVSGMTESLRHELAPFGIRVVLIEPGPFKTDIFGRNKRLARRAADPAGPYWPFVKRVEASVEKMVERTAQDPGVVVKRICAVLGQQRPVLKHPMGWTGRARVVLAKALPDRVYASLVGMVWRG